MVWFNMSFFGRIDRLIDRSPDRLGSETLVIAVDGFGCSRFQKHEMSVKSLFLGG